MEKTKRTHGYSLCSFIEDLTQEGEEKLFDLCEAFMTAQEYARFENDEWQILGEQCAQITLMYKPTGIYYTVNIDISHSMDDVWNELMEADRKYEEEVQLSNSRILRAIESVKGKQFAEDLNSYANGESDITGPWEIVRKTKGGYQTEDEFGSITGMWVDQWRNGGYEGDDFAGDVYIELKKDRYLKMGYTC